MANLKLILEERLRIALNTVAGFSADPMVHRSQFADYQADGAIAVARQIGRSPKDVASFVVATANLSDVCNSVEVSGPGFINLGISNAFLEELAEKVALDKKLDACHTSIPETVVVDYSSPNAAKEMHVGHLRSTVIGDAIVRLHQWLGHKVIRQNHIGDWGTPFGMLIEHLVDIGEYEAARELSVGELSEFYQTARKKFDTDADFANRSRNRVVLLQSGDANTLVLWKVLVEQSVEYFETVYGKLDVQLSREDIVGESAYNSELPTIIKELSGLNLLQSSDGALCMFPKGFSGRDGRPLPLIVQKKDGGYGYATTDLAAVRHRLLNLNATRILYVVGLPQALHLRMIFQAAREAGWVRGDVQLEHAGFGSILGPDGKLLRTRSGTPFKLINLIDEAVARATATIRERGADRLSSREIEDVAYKVGVGAIKYADLSTARSTDYIFDYKKMLSFDGNTAPYLQYAYARICSIMDKAKVDIEGQIGKISISHKKEHDLLLELLSFDEVISELRQNLEFHKLCGLLFAIATTFTAFYEHCPVMTAESDVKISRLALCSLTAKTLRSGMWLLGISSLDRM